MVSKMDEKYYTDKQIANLLHISLSRLRAKICQGSPLPNRIEPPGTRTRLWKKEEVHQWLEKFTVSTEKADSSIRRISKS